VAVTGHPEGSSTLRTDPEQRDDGLAAAAPISDADWEAREFSAPERRKLRKLMRDWDRCHWGWRMLFYTVAYSTAVIGGLYAMRDFLWRVIRAFFGQGG
jgi:hypothetical protein